MGLDASITLFFSLTLILRFHHLTLFEKTALLFCKEEIETQPIHGVTRKNGYGNCQNRVLMGICNRR